MKGFRSEGLVLRGNNDLAQRSFRIDQLKSGAVVSKLDPKTTRIESGDE